MTKKLIAYTITHMKITYDMKKSQVNIESRGLPFDLVSLLDWKNAIIEQDDRQDYGEVRMRAFCPNSEGRLFIVVFTIRDNMMRIISFRKANKRERNFYEKRD